MAVPLVVPVFGRRRRRSDVSATVPEATLHLITSYDPGVNLYEALVPHVTPTPRPISLDDMWNYYHQLFVNLGNLDDLDNARTQNEAIGKERSDLGILDDSSIEIDDVQEEDEIGNITTTPTQLPPTTTTAVMNDAVDLPEPSLFPPLDMNPLDVVEGAPASDMFSAVPGLQLHDPDPPKKKPIKITQVVKKRRPSRVKGGGCLARTGCSLGVVLAMAGLAVGPILVGRRRRREVQQGVDLGQHNIAILRDLHHLPLSPDIPLVPSYNTTSHTSLSDTTFSPLPLSHPTAASQVPFNTSYSTSHYLTSQQTSHYNP